ncbi:hypothetical protein GZ77_02230 [Endozoicomonas montiporae]|uniref:Wadjet protein JetD C-terminal domain-containing protein n=2 Tax=Endozoicomonas montiporae TaxID=1027273 RepID=A0A081NAK5_9GAMM|nr:DUF3322 domain-containing protein [Endozoicomonas montiporae]AMO56845.1 hypothetical protein EZMO1_2795 [Endozoicomonas montiporae CL-33]KEQ15478.1 hypothetical protein GZ77_02230 [Endozoicomonas montiporae]
MITQKELLKKAMRPWSTGGFLREWLANETVFPLEIPFKTPSGRTLTSDFGKIRDWIATLSSHSKSEKGTGYQLEYKTINHNQLGQQRLPHKIVFEDRNDWLDFIGRKTAFRQFDEIAGMTRRQLPDAMQFLSRKPLKALEYAESWHQLIKVCRYFQIRPRPDRYIRQLDIQGVDTKFIENHKGILTELLTLVLEEEDFDDSVTGLSENGFERRYGLRFDESLIRFRLLDSDQPVTDMSVPLSQFVEQPVSTVYITENKVNGLTFPAVTDAMVIFGLGYGIRSLGSVEWLKDKQITYWGDVDTHGFSILSVVRSMFPQTQSLLMDQTTLDEHKHLCVQEAESKRFNGSPDNLTQPESQLLDDLQNNRQGENLRLEQERIGYSYVMQSLR